MDEQIIIKGTATKPFDPIGSVFRNWLEIIVVGTLLFGLLVPVAFLVSKPCYEAEGKLRIDPVIPALLGPTEEISITAYYHDYVRTQVNRIQELEVIEGALETLPEESKYVFLIEGKSSAFSGSVLGRRLAIAQIRDTHLIKIYLSGEKPDGLSEVINAIMDTYLARLLDEESGKNNRRLSFLEEEKKRLEEEIAVQIRNKNILADLAGTSTFSEMFNIYNRQLQDLQEAYTRAYGKRVEKENILNNAIREEKALGNISLAPLVDEMVERDESLWDTSFWTYKTMQEMRASLDGVTLDNPDRKYIEDRMLGMENYLSKLRKDVRTRAKRIIYQKRDVELQQKIIAVRTQYLAAKEGEEEIRAERDRVQVESAKITGKLLEGQRVETELEHLRALLDRTNDRIHALKLEARAPGRIRLESLARPPEEAAGNNRNKFLALFFVGAFGATLVGSVLYELQDDRIRSVKDIVNALGFPPTWPVSNYQLTGGRGKSFSRVSIEDPENVVAKALRSLAVRADKERREHGAQIALITGVDAGSGVSSILLNAAHAMNQLCPNVLVLETNHSQPCFVNVIKCNKEKPGLFDLLLGEAEINGCLQQDSDRGFDFLPAGRQMSKDALSQLDYHIFSELLSQLKKKYDFIFLDSAPLLRSDLTEYLIVHADMGMLVIHGDRSRYADLRRAAEILSRLELKTFGGILNWGGARHLSRLQILVADIFKPLRGLKR